MAHAVAYLLWVGGGAFSPPFQFAQGSPPMRSEVRPNPTQRLAPAGALATAPAPAKGIALATGHRASRNPTWSTLNRLVPSWFPLIGKPRPVAKPHTFEIPPNMPFLLS